MLERGCRADDPCPLFTQFPPVHSLIVEVPKATKLQSATLPQLIPVLDLLGGHVVRGVAGRRDEYRPIESPLASGSNPVAIAEAIQDRYGLTRFYVADLDGIQQRTPDLHSLKRLSAAGFRLIVDAGSRTADDAQLLLDLGISRVIAGLESSPGPKSLEQLIARCGPDRLVFSLDLRRGQPIVDTDSAWSELTPDAIADRALSMGVQTLLVLDLVAVGMDRGVTTLEFVRRLRRRYPAVDLWTGGGIRDAADIQSASVAGADGILVASALHAGKLDDLLMPAASERSEESVTREGNGGRLLARELTPPGRGAVATIQLRGDLRRADVPTPLFAARNDRGVSRQPLDRICFGRWGTESPEDVVVCRTGADLAEVHCHGGRAAVRRIIGDLQARGAVVETAAGIQITTLPFLESECESALQRATTERTAMLLAEQRSGVLRSGFQEIRQLLDRGDPNALHDARKLADRLLTWSRFGLHLTRPWSVVLCGRPNVGKSSLINALAGFTRSIVSPHAGTTRDVVTASIVLEGWPIELSDTAGLRMSADEIESAGVDRARNRLLTADLKLVLIDVSEPLSDADRKLFSDYPDALVVGHKSDLPSSCDLSQHNAWTVSSLTGRGLPELMAEVVDRLVPDVPPPGTPVPVTETLVAMLRQLRRALAEGDTPSAVIVLDRLLELGPS